MPKEEWGAKRVCPSCAVRFYDLMRDPMTCPSCGAEFSLESLKNTRPRGTTERVTAAKSSDKVAAVDDVDVDLDDDDTGDVELDDEILDDDDEDGDVSLDDLSDVGPDDEEN